MRHRRYGVKQEESFLFVYGSLKRGFANHTLLSAARYVDTCWTAPLYRLYVYGNYPAMVFHENGISIEGEVYRVDGSTLEQIDIFEEVPVEYRRVPVFLQNLEFRVETYLFQKDVKRLPLGGNCWTGSPHFDGYRFCC